jgi:peptidoglycan/xylan/chitin deacetylase (PgdA/CDA1 family)
MLMRWRVRLSGRKLGLIVCYHAVGDPGGDPARDLVPAVDCRLFRRQLEHLKTTYRVLPLDEVLVAAQDRRPGMRVPVAITFDDDLPSHVANAMPELTRVGLPASFFLCGGSLEEPFSYWWEDLQRHVDAGGDMPALPAKDIHDLATKIERLPPPERDHFADTLRQEAPSAPANAGMRVSDVRTLANAGFEIGFHTRGHYLLTGLDDDQLARQLRDGLDVLEEAASQSVSAIAYPHGKADDRVALAARKAGYRWALTARGEPVHPAANPQLLGRIDASPRSLGRFAFDLARTLTRSPAQAAPA